MIIKTKENTIPPKMLKIIFNVKSFISTLLARSVYYTIFLASIAIAKEPLVVQIEKILSNDIQKVQFKNYTFFINTYGIVDISEIFHKNNHNKSCQKNLTLFYQENPKAKYFTQNLIKQNNLYHIDIKNNGTILYVQGVKSLSLLLLENGLAIVQKNFKDEEHLFQFLKAQRNAKIKKKGIWKKMYLQNCSLQ